jgi:KipI family sensor histidine kinase inhibitor
MRAAPRVRAVGDRGVLLELRDNEEVHRVAAAARERFGGVLAEVVAGHRTVLLAWPVPPVDRGVVEAVCAAGDAPAAAPEPRCVTVPVIYDGPDLDVVADQAGLSREEVVRRHAGGRYRVAFVGFAPGFAYLLGADPALHVPRREDPRERVEAGSVALAGEYTAVYPSASPGGWQLIGRTDARMFDPTRDPPAMLEPGMEVVFEAAP